MSFRKKPIYFRNKNKNKSYVWEKTTLIIYNCLTAITATAITTTVITVTVVQ